MLSRAATEKVEKTKDLRIKMAGLEEANTTVGGLRNASSATSKTVETTRSDGIPTNPPIKKNKIKCVRGNISWFGPSLNYISTTTGT